VVDAATEAGATTLKFTGAELYLALAASGESAILLTFDLEVTNWLGVMRTATSATTLTDSSIPIISRVSEEASTMDYEDPLILKVKVANPPSSCVSGETGSFKEPSVQYYNGNTAVAACETGVTEEMCNKGVAKTTLIMSGLSPDTTYDFTARTFYDSEESGYTEVTFTVVVNPMTPPAVSLSAPTEAQASCAIIVDGSLSSDVNVPSTAKLSDYLS
jgi:hypothetical protein